MPHLDMNHSSVYACVQWPGGGGLVAAQRLMTWWAVVESPFSTGMEQGEMQDLGTWPLSPASKADTASDQKQTFRWLISV